jgi:hypothetical protein
MHGPAAWLRIMGAVISTDNVAVRHENSEGMNRGDKVSEHADER